MKTIRNFFLASLLLTSLSAYAGGSSGTYGWVNTGSGSYRDNNCYVGLKAVFGEFNNPSVLAGCRTAKVESSNHVDGFDMSIAAKFLDGFAFEKLRGKYFNGDTNAQGELGGGYDFSAKSFLLGASVKAPYATLGLDFLPGAEAGRLQPYVQLDTKGNYSKPSSRVCALLEGGIYIDNQCQLGNPSDRRLKNSIHFIAKLASGLKIYSFKYNWSNKTYVGVMAQDLLKNPAWSSAVGTLPNGYYGVNYSSLGLRMTTLSQWNKEGLSSIQLH